MQCKIIAVLRILLLTSIFQKACRGIDCYQCKSDVNANCDTRSVDLQYLRPCPKSHGYCRKSNFIYYFTDSPKIITIRECAMLGTERKDCYRGRYRRDSYQQICECKDSGCNRSTNLFTGISGIVVFTQLIVHYFFVSLARKAFFL